MKMKKLVILSGLMLLFSTGLLAQQVTGKVVDEQNEPLPGVSILVKGTTRGAITDFDGNYTIQAQQGDVLVFSYVGFTTREVRVTGSTVNVTLQSGVELDNVVVIGSRNVNRTATDTAVPVDVLDVAELAQATPQITVEEILNYAAPSFTSNPPTFTSVRRAVAHDRHPERARHLLHQRA